MVALRDTVSSIGITRGPSFPETTTGMVHVRVFRHAISLHEKRIKFLPEHAKGGTGPLSKGGNVKEVWFAGSHSDMYVVIAVVCIQTQTHFCSGGGIATNLKLRRFGPPLRWMLYEALEFGLRVEPYQGGWSDAKHTPSMTPGYRILELLPLKRLRYVDKDGTAMKRW